MKNKILSICIVSIFLLTCIFSISVIGIKTNNTNLIDANDQNTEIKTSSNYWKKIFGTPSEYDVGHSLIISDGYMVCGQQGADILLFKVDSSGDTVWKQTYDNNENYDSGQAIQRTNDGGFIIAGRSSDDDKTDGILIKTNNIGEEQWSCIYENLIIWNMKQTNDDGYILCGQEAESVLLLKADKHGLLEWKQTFDIKGYNDRGEDVIQTDDGGYLVFCLGGTKEYSTWDIYLLKTDNNGNLEQEIILGSTHDADVPESISQTSDGGYIIGAVNGLVIKLDSNYNIEFEKTIKSFSSLRYIEQTNDGGYIIGGQVEEETNSVFQYYDVLVIKTDNNCNTEWQKTYTNDLRSYDSAFSIHQTSDNGFIIGARSRKDIQNNYDIMLIRTNSNGDLRATRSLNNNFQYYLKILFDKFPYFHIFLN